MSDSDISSRSELDTYKRIFPDSQDRLSFPSPGRSVRPVPVPYFLLPDFGVEVPGFDDFLLLSLSSSARGIAEIAGWKCLQDSSYPKVIFTRSPGDMVNGAFCPVPKLQIPLCRFPSNVASAYQ